MRSTEAEQIARIKNAKTGSRRPPPVEELFINTDPEDGADVDHV